jgi:acetylornithine deacetylase/succinyl-diaminopimelate desuccinylase-like protein
MTDLRLALDFAQANQVRFVEELKEFIRIPSISTDPAAMPEMQRAAAWVAEKLRSLGMQNVAVLPTAGKPVVFGELLAAGPDKPTVLVYGHYDVQPVEPLELWNTDPFEAVQIGENLYARGASDMKGQIMVALKAIEALQQAGGMPVNVKVLIEGEEEIGSPNLNAFIAEHRELLASDIALNPDTGMIAPDLPTITYGLRGMVYFELRLSGPKQDLHSGMYGGAVHNPAQVLCEVVAGMHDAQGRVTLPGFYDRVRPLSAEERAELARLPLDEAFYLEQTGVPALRPEAGYTPLESIGGRPTLEVNGLISGFTGEGQKTVLPAKAMAKISMRLVPDQEPEEVHQKFRRYLEAAVPPTVHWELVKMSGGYPSLTDRHLPAVEALCQAMEATFGKRPVFRREGGSVPVVAQMQTILGIPSVLTGFGLPDDNLHAPNEKTHLPTLWKGLDTLIRFFVILGGD